MCAILTFASLQALRHIGCSQPASKYTSHLFLHLFRQVKVKIKNTEGQFHNALQNHGWETNKPKKRRKKCLLEDNIIPQLIGEVILYVIVVPVIFPHVSVLIFIQACPI